MSFSAITASMTQWKCYQKQEMSDEDNDFWEKMGTFTSFDNISKVKISSKKAEQSIARGSLFKEGYYPVSLIQLRNQLVHLAANEMTQRFLNDISSLKTQVIDLTKEVAAVTNDQSILFSTFNPIEKMKAVTQNLTQFNEKIQTELKIALENPIRFDKRCNKKNIVKLGEHYTTPRHQQYVQLINKWTQKEQILKDVTQEECWKWKGQLKALRLIETQLAFLAYAVHKSACCADVFTKNASNQEFWTPSKQVEKEEAEKVKQKAKQNEKERMEKMMGFLGSSLIFGDFPDTLV